MGAPGPSCPTQKQSHTDTFSTGEKPSPGGCAAGGTDSSASPQNDGKCMGAPGPSCPTQKQSHTDTFSTGEKPSPGGCAAGGYGWRVYGQPGGQVISRPPSTWKCRWWTLWPACIPHRAFALRGPRFSLYLLGRNESARHQGFGLCPKHLDTPDGVPRSAGTRRAGCISREARSCHVRPARGSADGGRTGPPARRCWRPPGSSQGPGHGPPWR